MELRNSGGDCQVEWEKIRRAIAADKSSHNVSRSRHKTGPFEISRLPVITCLPDFTQGGPTLLLLEKSVIPKDLDLENDGES